MTNARAQFEVDGLAPAELLVRYEILAEGLQKLPDGRPDPRAIADDTKLAEMAAILGALRRKSAGPPKINKRVKQPLTAPTLDQL